MLEKILFVSALLISSPAFCLSISSTKVNMAGTEGHGGRLYVSPADNPTGCAWGGVYFTDPNEQKQTLAVALAAKATNGSVRIDYEQPGGPGNQCFGYSIYLN